MTEYSESDKKIILKDYRSLLKATKKVRKTAEDTARIRKAFNVAADAHMSMRRKSGEPYITHPIAVAKICAEEIGLGVTSIVCALLHDTVEDTEITLDDIESLFGKKERNIIDGLTKISGVFDFSTSDQAENFRKMILTLPDDVRVIFIKLADRLHNMRTLDSMRKDKQLKIASETLFLYAPLAHRLGVNMVKSELENLALKFKEPEEYDTIQGKLRKTNDVRTRFINAFIEPLKKELEKQGLKFTIKGRPKSIFSIWNKIKTKHVSFEEIYDLFAIRVILDTPVEYEKADCWKVYSVVTDFYRPNPDRLRDWVTTPRGNGYESLHTTVMSPSGKWVEVQIRTERMDEVAEKGFAAHWKYKESKGGKQSGFDNWINKIRDLIENNHADTLEFIDDFKLSLYAEEIYVFTPKGQLKMLPAKATALDFAFDIHTDVGKKCIGAKVNHKLVPLSHELKSGDQVEIITSNKQVPKEAWLNFVVTSRAKSKIKQSIKESYNLIAEDGKEILMRKLKNLKVTLNDKAIHELVKLYETKNFPELNYLIAKGKIDLSKIKNIVEKGGELNFKKEVVEQPVNEENTRQKDNTSDLITNFGGKSSEAIILGDDSLSQVDYTFAKCCSPIPGDDVFGFITIKEGIKIHRNNCPNATQLMAHYAYRVLKVQWKSQKIKEFSSEITFTGIDNIGVLHSITTIITNNLNINMQSLNIGSNDGMFEGKIKALVYDTAHLDQLISSIKKVEGINEVKRTS
jgi:guanosine-3',5'-bis(diphosphate) 3'-pyrophosphohydrolase